MQAPDSLAGLECWLGPKRSRLVFWIWGWDQSRPCVMERGGGISHTYLVGLLVRVRGGRVGEARDGNGQRLSIAGKFSSVQSLSRVLLFAIHQASLSITNSRSLRKLMSTESVMPSNHLILCRPRLLLPSIFPSIRVFSNESALLIKWPKYWSLSFSISPSNEYSGLISFRIAWFDLIAVQGTLKSLLQHHSSKASILKCSALFMVQLSHPYTTTGKTIALTIQTFVHKMTSLLFNTLSRFVIAFLPRSKLF